MLYIGVKQECCEEQTPKEMIFEEALVPSIAIEFRADFIGRRI